MTVIRILFAAVFVWFVCLGAGDLLFRALGLKFRRRERIFLAFLTGAALVSTGMFLLAAATLVYTKVVVILGLAIVGVWIWRCRPDFRSVTGLGPALPTLWQIVFWAPLLIYGCLYLLSALAPETDPDGTVYHVGLITRYYDHRGFFPIHTEMYAGLAEGIEMLFWIAFSLGRHSAAAMVELLFLLAMPFGMIAYGERIKMPRAGVVGAMLFYLAPVVGKAGSIPYIDVATGAVVFGTFYLLQIWREEGGNSRDRMLLPAGLLAGFCFACKITASTAVIYAIVFALVVAVNRAAPGTKWKNGLRAALIVTGCACLTAVPWMIKDAIEFHNPFFPLFNHWFPNPYLYPMVEDDLRRLMAHTSDVPYIQMPFELAMGGKLFGTIGPVFLLAPLALLSLRFPAGRQLLIAFVPMFLPFFGNTGARFFIPALPFLSLALAMAFVEMRAAGPALAVGILAVHAYTSWPGTMERLLPRFQWRLDPIDLRADLRLTPEKEYLSTHWTDYNAGLLLDRFVPAGELVYSPSMSQLVYHHREIIGSFDSARARKAWDTMLGALPGPLSNQWHRDIRFAAVSTSKMRLQPASKTENESRIGELRFFDGDTEIMRSPEWRLTASRNPWEVQLAFDNDPLSWWTSGQVADFKTWIEVDFPQPVRIDRITVDQIEDQRWLQLQPVADVAGRWTPLKTDETGALSPPAPDLRMRLKDELKSMGIRWILIRDGGIGADDFRTKSPWWGIQQIAETNGYRLWKLL